jgi:hypothetical protein
VIPVLLRIIASNKLSGSTRRTHFTIVASGVTVYRALGFFACTARKITRAQSSGVVPEDARAAFRAFRDFP